MGKIKLEDSGEKTFKLAGKTFLKGQYVIEYTETNTDENGVLTNTEKATVFLRPIAYSQIDRQSSLPFKTPVSWLDFVDSTGAPYADFDTFSNALAVAIANFNSGGATPTLQEVTDEGNVVEYGSETTFAKYKTSDDVFAKIVSDDDGFLGFETQIGVGDKTTYKMGIIVSNFGGVPMAINIPAKSGTMGLEAIQKTASFTAENDQPYTTNGTLTITDPTPVTNKGYIVHVISGTTTIDGVGYTAGALVYRYYNGSVWTSVNYKPTGATGSFLSADAKTITVVDGIITSIV